MSELELIRARAAKPDEVMEWAGNPYVDEYIGALQESQADVVKLVGLLEKIRGDMAERADQFETTSRRLWKQVEHRDPDRDVEDAQRYTAYAAGARATANIIARTIEEGLNQ